VINPSKINQDVNEKHNGNSCQEGGGTNTPMQVHVIASVDNSSGMCLGWADRGNCLNNPVDQHTNLPLQKQPPIKKICSAGNHQKKIKLK
jgi:hypothetical protein